MKIYSWFLLLLLLRPAHPAVKIVWSEKRKLSISDFTIVDPRTYNSVYGAECHHKITVAYETDKDSITYHVSSVFDPQLSWMKYYQKRPLNAEQATLNQFQETRGLQHEQGHFDLGEMYARKIRRLMSNYQAMGSEERLADSIACYLKEMVTTEQLYDRQTLHAQNVENQQSWNRQILKMLDSLAGYGKANATLSIR